MENKEFNVSKYLSKDEINNLEYLNHKSNSIKNLEKEKTDIMNISLKELLHQWSSVNVEIFNELTDFFTNLKKFNNYFEDIDNTSNILDGINLIFTELLEIFIKENRSMYAGLTFILISFFIYFIGISS